jgi:capsular exopolysaccharide synthesis family protein
MSRIHEALKKAEQERAVSQGAPNVVSARNEWPQESAAAVADVPTNGSAAYAQALQEVSPGSFTEEMLLTRSTPAQWHPVAKTMLFFGADENARLTEQFRTLRSRFYSMRERMPLKSILVASALPQEGKSFVAANLAQVLAGQQGRRVLLIDGDMRVPSLYTAFGTNSAPGLVDYLTGAADELSIIQRGQMENLFFLPSGSSSDDPSDLVNNGRLGLLLKRIGHLFEWIIIDSPPAVPVSDASQLSQYCDGVLMVVRSNSTPYDSAQRAQREFQGKALVGVVLNGTMPEGAYARYSYETYEKVVRQKS